MLIDRYLFRLVASRVLAIVALVIAILALANVRNLTNDLTRTNAALQLLARLSLLLVPEHLALAIPVAVFLGTALAVRTLTLRGEWPIFAAAGLGAGRLLAAPMAVAVLAAGVQLGDRLGWRPAGERGLDRLYGEIAAGAYGTPLSVGEPVPFDAGTTLLAGGVSAAGGPLKLTDVVIHKRDDDWTAPRATVSSDRAGEVVLELEGGEATHRLPDGGSQSVRFGRLTLHGRPPALGLVLGNLRQRLDRLGAPALLALPRAPVGTRIQDAALAALVGRVESGLFVLLLPILGVSLGQPRLRRSNGWGLLVGIVLIVAHIQAASVVEDHLWHWPVLAGVVHWLIWAAFIAWGRRRLFPWAAGRRE